MRLLAIALCSLLSCGVAAARNRSRLPQPSPTSKNSQIYPSKIASRAATTLRSSSSRPHSMNGKLVDLTGDANYDVADAKVATRHERAAACLPLGNGTTEITASFGDKSRASRRHGRACRREPADQLRQPGRADLHQARLQQRRLPRQGQRPERLPAVAARLRAGTRLRDPREGRPRPPRCSPPPPNAACC